MKSHISFRLRKGVDVDLINLNIDDGRLNDLCRDGLRLILGLRTTRRVEVTEKPLNAPQVLSKSAVWRPNKGG